MATLVRQPQEARTRDILLVLVGVFGLSASITLIWLGMRAAAVAVWAFSTLAT